MCLLTVQAAHAKKPKEYVTVVVNEAYVEMRKAPGNSYPVFYVAERGETLRVLKSRTDWYKVKNNRGITGWVYASAMAKTRHTNGEPLAIKQPDRKGYQNRRFEAGFMLGDFGGSDMLNIYGSYFLTQNLSAEINYTETFGQSADGQGGFINLVHQPFPTWRISPFVTIGAGSYEITPKARTVSTKSRTDNSSFSGAGLRMHLTQRLLLRLQYNNYLLLNNEDDDEEIESWTLGISTFY